MHQEQSPGRCGGIARRLHVYFRKRKVLGDVGAYRRPCRHPRPPPPRLCGVCCARGAGERPHRPSETTFLIRVS